MTTTAYIVRCTTDPTMGIITEPVASFGTDPMFSAKLARARVAFEVEANHPVEAEWLAMLSLAEGALRPGVRMLKNSAGPAIRPAKQARDVELAAKLVEVGLRAAAVGNGGVLVLLFRPESKSPHCIKFVEASLDAAAYGMSAYNYPTREQVTDTQDVRPPDHWMPLRKQHERKGAPLEDRVAAAFWMIGEAVERFALAEQVAREAEHAPSTAD